MADPHRARWALQHLPYPVAKFVRTKMSLSNRFVSNHALVAWESRIFQMAWDQARDEGGLRTNTGEPA